VKDVNLVLSVEVDVDVCDCVCRWVKWTSLVECCPHSLMSFTLFTCHSTAKVTCWSLTVTMIAYYCWVPVVSYSYSVSSLTTQPLKSSCGGQNGYITTNSRHNCTLHISAVVLTSSRCSLYVEWLSHRCCRLLY